MKPSSHGSQEYLKSAVMTASAEQLQLMLLDGAIRFASRGREALAAKDREAALDALERAQRIVLEMSIGLNRDANSDLVDQMRGLYSFVYRRLVDANMNQDPAALDESIRILKHQRETWSLIADKVQSAVAARTVKPDFARTTNPDVARTAKPDAARPPGTSGLIAGRIQAPSPVDDASTRFIAEA